MSTAEKTLEDIQDTQRAIDFIEAHRIKAFRSDGSPPWHILYEVEKRLQREFERLEKRTKSEIRELMQ